MLIACARRAETPLFGAAVQLGRGFVAQIAAAGPLARCDLALPSDASLCGRELVTQAGLFGGGQPFALTNAQDLVLGFP